MDENILAAIRRTNEAVPLGLVEPLDSTGSHAAVSLSTQALQNFPSAPRRRKAIVVARTGGSMTKSLRRSAGLRRILPDCAQYGTRTRAFRQLGAREKWRHPGKKKCGALLEIHSSGCSRNRDEQASPAPKCLSRGHHQAFHFLAIGAVACGHSQRPMTTLIFHYRKAEIALRLLVN